MNTLDKDKRQVKKKSQAESPTFSPGRIVSINVQEIDQGVLKYKVTAVTESGIEFIRYVRSSRSWQWALGLRVF